MEKGILDKILDIPPHFIYAAVIIALFLSMVLPSIPSQDINPYVKTAYNYIQNNVKDGDVVLLNMGNSYAYFISHLPGTTAVLNHLLSQHKVKLIIFGTRVDAPLIWSYAILPTVQETLAKKGYVYGVDWVNFGYISGGEVGLGALSADMRVKGADLNGTPLDQLPVMTNVKNGGDIKLFLEAGIDIQLDIRQFWAKWNTPIIEIGHPGAITVSPRYVESKQIIGFLYGWPGTAMYENLVKSPGLASTGSMVISVSYIAILVAIFVPNIIYIANKMRGKKQ